ncbi:MAG: N-acetyltransferase [Deltaproteobacteria bacterium]|nr:N-acetyltransferase [Deltaproteobacteria bacterium]
MDTLQVRRVETKKENDDFFLLPWDLHGKDPNWVPPLLIAVKDLLNERKNPFFKHAALERWVAYRGGERVGRIAGIVDRHNNLFHDEETAFWGFFECVNDAETARALFAAVEGWGRGQAMTVLRGPVNPSTNHECGLQISAFDTKPFIMMTQNPPYYPELVEKAGCAKAKDLYAWIIDDTAEFDPKLVQRAELLEKSEDIRFRTVDMKHYDEEIEKILLVYNDAWEKNWGFVPMTPEEFRHMAKEMKAIVVPELLYIVEVKGDTAGFALCLPDINQVFEKIRDGRLFPTGLLKLLWHTKVRKTMNRGRILALGLKKKYQAMGLAPVMYLRYFREAPKLGYRVAECSWVLEDNVPMNAGLKYLKARHYKTYRIYDKPLLA